MIAENRDRNWKGCKLHLKPSTCGIDEERARNGTFE
jgi:hypothetical protein